MRRTIIFIDGSAFRDALRGAVRCSVPWQRYK